MLDTEQPEQLIASDIPLGELQGYGNRVAGTSSLSLVSGTQNKYL